MLYLITVDGRNTYFDFVTLYQHNLSNLTDIGQWPEIIHWRRTMRFSRYIDVHADTLSDLASILDFRKAIGFWRHRI